MVNRDPISYDEKDDKYRSILSLADINACSTGLVFGFSGPNPFLHSESTTRSSDYTMLAVGRGSFYLRDIDLTVV